MIIFNACVYSKSNYKDTSEIKPQLLHNDMQSLTHWLSTDSEIDGLEWSFCVNSVPDRYV